MSNDNENYLESLTFKPMDEESLANEALNESSDHELDDQLEPASDKAMVSAPNQLMIGFYSNVKKKDVERFIRARAESKMSLKSAWYNIVRYEDGFAWELHEGGSGRGVLKSVIRLLDSEPQVTICLSNETIKVTRRTNHSGLVAFRIPDSEDVEETPSIEYVDSMKPVLKSGLGLFVTGLVFAALGILAVFLASLFKFVLLNENEPYQHAKQVTDLPISQIQKLEYVTNLEGDGVFIQSLIYKDGKWQVNTGVEEPQAPKSAPAKPEQNPSSTNARDNDSEMVRLSRTIDNTNANNANRLPPEIEQQLNNKKGN